MKKIYTLFFITAAFLMGGCSSDEPKVSPAEEETPPVEVSDEAPEVTIDKLELEAAEAQAAADIKKFGLDFFKAASAEMPGKNMVVSPLSASMLLSMIANVADEKTEAQITAALGTDNLEALNATSHKLMAWLPKADTAVKLGLANSIWHKYNYSLEDDFRSVALENYLTDLYARNFSDPSLVTDEINRWIDDKTEGVIDNAIPRNFITKEMVSVLVNTLYFKGAWIYPFDELLTEKESFYGSAGESEVDMMSGMVIDGYCSNDIFEAISIAIGDEETMAESFSMIFALPKDENMSLDRAIAAGLPDPKDFSEKYVSTRLPKFSIKPEELVNLNDVFEALGIDNLDNLQGLKMFREQVEANFKTYQKATVTVNEVGVEGASASFSGIDWSAGSDMEIIKLHFNRPFAFMLVEKNTGVCLLAGKVTNL